jgi:anti-sigma regulatory factor (Ser/Thr protein kinase)
MYFSEVLPKAAAAAAMARRALDRLTSEVDRQRLEDARLLVTELIANAVEHVAEDGALELRVDNDDERLRVEVIDPGPGFLPDADRPGELAESGWGLHFVSRIADRWGAEADGTGRVWFELMSR